MGSTGSLFSLHVRCTVRDTDHPRHLKVKNCNNSIYTSRICVSSPPLRSIVFSIAKFISSILLEELEVRCPDLEVVSLWKANLPNTNIITNTNIDIYVNINRNKITGMQILARYVNGKPSKYKYCDCKEDAAAIDRSLRGSRAVFSSPA